MTEQVATCDYKGRQLVSNLRRRVAILVTVTSEEDQRDVDDDPAYVDLCEPQKG